MPLTFHIVYIPGTVDYLLPFVSTLLRWSACHFRLVANGCSESEVGRLQARCANEPRLETVILPTNRPLLHQVALNSLQSRCSDDFFCFMDSDILAVGPFMTTITPLLAAHAGVFAGAPLWCRPSDQVFHPGMDVVCGEHDRTTAGLPLGGTYFAIYDNRVLTDFIRATEIGFERRGFSQLPTSLQAWCAERDLAGPRHFYDTGKALNLGLLRAGHKLAVNDSPSLFHLGGLSGIAKRKWYDAQKGIIGVWGVFYRLARNAYVELRRRLRDDPFNRSRKLPFGRRRQVYRLYFTALLAAAADGRKPPPRPAEGDVDVRRRAQVATEQILALTYDRTAQTEREAAH